MLGLGRIRLYDCHGFINATLELSCELWCPVYDASGGSIAVAEPGRGIAEPRRSGHGTFTKPGRCAFAKPSGGGLGTITEPGRCTFAKPSGDHLCAFA